MNKQPFDKQPYLALALDPIHVGTGGYRLGRVDMSIVREPGTNLPKVPGTSLSGACRTYATMQHPDKWPHCAGQGQPDEKRSYGGHCGKPDCPICVTFGFTKGEGGSFQGLAQFSDARLVLCPVHSFAGPIWVTCPDVLSEQGIEKEEPRDGELQISNGVEVNGKLNLGWLMFGVKNGFSFDDKLEMVPAEIKQRTVLVSNRLFGQIVNDNLEVRTSVSIDPATGAAAERALFTYEALPRASLLGFEVIISNPKYYCINGKVPLSNLDCYSKEQGDQEKQVQDGIGKVKGTVQQGLRFFKSLGIGGMNTRGMGRMRVLGVSESGGE